MEKLYIVFHVAVDGDTLQNERSVRLLGCPHFRGNFFISKRGRINHWDMSALLRCPLLRGSTVVTCHKLLWNNTQGPGSITIVDITCSCITL